MHYNSFHYTYLDMNRLIKLFLIRFLRKKNCNNCTFKALDNKLFTTKYYNYLNLFGFNSSFTKSN